MNGVWFGTKYYATCLVGLLVGAALLLGSGETAGGLMALVLALLPVRDLSSQRGADGADTAA